MASSSTITCPPPFVSDADYQRGGGYVHGRFCGINPGVPGQKCCLPCPVQDWVYPEEFTDKLKIANYVGISSVALCGFLLLSFLVLPPERSNRHYLTIGVTLAITFFSIPFLIPLGTKPDMCYDKITPNGQGSDISCAWTGALLLLGAMGSALWIFLRALWLHLRVCWEVDPGRPFMIISTAAGLAIPAAFTAVALTITGVSYRVGLVCLPNHRRAIVTFWAWEVGFAGAALLVQGATTGYCIWVYLLVLFRGRKRVAGAREAGTGQISANGRRPPDHSSFANESTSSSGSARPQNTWRKMRRMLLMQWRGIALTVIMAVESLFYIIVFVAQDTRFGEVASKANEPDARTWSACLVLTGGNRSACLIYAGKLAISQDLVLGSLLLGSVSTARYSISFIPSTALLPITSAPKYKY
ncbi:hypothetical protein B0J12DRAFT_580073 [Macrophomina phaseolina]|uniref:G-protein coupled receptors family 2 profile 2 domain-containing protein n=1 Tax=Macrophomina phaseolina TaxID=35725 RepID=A0ABQ8G0V6_9PEZI|nr:hypothetical protein B0J12DRAFT_580073 [Macrophomina phaseolina]